MILGGAPPQEWDFKFQYGWLQLMIPGSQLITLSAWVQKASSGLTFTMLFVCPCDLCDFTRPCQFSSVQSSVAADSLQPHGLQHARPPCPSPTPGACSNSCPLSHWCHPTISSSVVPFSSFLQSLPASGSFLMSQFFTTGGQSIGASASTSVLPMTIQDWFPLGLNGLISLQSKGLSRVCSITTVQKYQFFDAKLSLESNSHIHTRLLKKP